jgi:hypothetical protein
MGQGLLAMSSGRRVITGDATEAAAHAFQLADAMLKERAQCRE